MAKKKGLWANIHAKRKRGEAPAKKGDKNYPETLDIEEGSMKTARKNVGADKCWDGYKAKGTKKKDGKTVPNCVKEAKSLTQFCAEAAIASEKDKEKRLKKIKELERLMKAAQAPKELSDVGKNTRKESIDIEDADGNAFVEVVDLIKPESMTGWRQQVAEVLDMKKAGMGEVVKDFYKSDAPQFKGKSKKKRQQMAIAAKLQSEAVYGGKEAEKKAAYEKQLKKMLPKRAFDQMGNEIDPRSGKKLEEAAWTKKEGQNKNGGLNEKGRKSYERENPGSDLKAPSKKVGNPRRKSFCARMKGMRKRQKPSNNTGDDRLSKSLRAWNC